jgi:hypothetical protein
LRWVKRFALLPCCIGMEALPESTNDMATSDPPPRRLAGGGMEWDYASESSTSRLTSESAIRNTSL